MIQQKYNEEHGITPKSIQKEIRDVIHATYDVDDKKGRKKSSQKDPEAMTKTEVRQAVAKLEKEMKKAAADLRFEEAAQIRDELIYLRGLLVELK